MAHPPARPPSKPFKAVLNFDVISDVVVGKTYSIVLDFSGVVGEFGKTHTGETHFILPALSEDPYGYYNLSDVIITGYETQDVKSLEFNVDEHDTGDVIAIEANLPSTVTRQFQGKITAFAQNRKIKLRQAR